MFQEFENGDQNTQTVRNTQIRFQILALYEKYLHFVVQ